MESPLRAGAGEPGLKLIETALWDGATAARAVASLRRLHGIDAACAPAGDAARRAVNT